MKTAKPQVQKITVAQAFTLWMKGTGRGALREPTGLGLLALRKAFVKLGGGKSWRELKAAHDKVKPTMRKAKVSQ